MPADSNRRWLLRSLTVVVGVALAGLVLVAAEYAARVLDPLTPQEQIDRDAFDYQAWTLGPCYRTSFGRLIPVRPTSELRHGGDIGETFSTKKPAGVKRIVVVGESTGEMLEKQLAEMTRGCHDKVEILRCSASGSRPFIAVRRVEQAVEWQPDAIVVAIGHNFMLPGPPTQPQLAINRSRLVHEMHRLLPSQPLPPPAPPTPKSGAVELDDMDPPAMGREAYRRILELTKPKGVQVVALVLSSNLWYRPNAEPGYLTSNDRSVAWVKWAQGDVPAAISVLGANEGPLRDYERARFRTESSDWTGALTDLQHARDLEAMPTRASTAVTANIREAAQQGGARVIEVEQLFAPLADHGIPGWDIYFDNVHPNPPALTMLARTVLATAAPDAASCQAPPAPPMPPADAYSRLVNGPTQVHLPDASADAETIRRRIDGPITTMLRQNPSDAAAILEKYDQEALAKAPPGLHAGILTGIAETARDAGRLDLARWCLDRSVAVMPTSPALLERALVEMRSHEEPAARVDAKKALELTPGDATGKALIAALGF